MAGKTKLVNRKTDKMVSKNSKKKTQETKSAAKNVVSSTHNSASSTNNSKAVNKSSAQDTSQKDMVQEKIIAGQIQMAKHFKTSTSSSSTSVTKQQEQLQESSSTLVSSSSNSTFNQSSKSQFHQQLSDEVSKNGKIISSIDLVSESAAQEPVFSVPIDVVEYVTSSSGGGMSKMYSSSSMKKSSSSTSQSMMEAITESGTPGTSLNMISGDVGGYIVDVEFKPETVIIRDDSTAMKKHFQQFEKSLNSATEMTSSSSATMSSQFITEESSAVHGTTIKTNKLHESSNSSNNYITSGGSDSVNRDVSSSSSSTQRFNTNTLTAADNVSQSNVGVLSETYEILLPASPMPATTTTTREEKTAHSMNASNTKSTVMSQAQLKSSKNINIQDEYIMSTANDDHTLHTSTTGFDNKLTTDKTTAVASTTSTNKDINKLTSNLTKTDKHVSKMETTTEDSLTKKTQSQSKKEFYDVKTKTWSEFHDGTTVNKKQPAYERLVSQDVDGKCKVTYKKKIYDQRNNRWRIVEEKVVDKAHDNGGFLNEITDDVINTTTTTYTTKVYDSKLGQWKVVDEKSYVDSQAYVPQDIVREIEKDNTDVANITTTTEITKVSKIGVIRS